MAKVGTTSHRWTKTTERDDNSGSVRRDYALRDDGVLLRKASFLNADGTVDFSDGWKVFAREAKIVANITRDIQILGFVRVSS